MRLDDLQDASADDDQTNGTPLATSMESKVEQAADLLRAIGSAHRLMILCLLTDADRTVTEICDATGMRQSLASQHLGRLRLDGIVKAERNGHFVRYSLDDPATREIVSVLYRHFCGDGLAPLQAMAQRAEA